MSKWANIDVLKARIDKDVKEDKVLDGWAFFFKVYLDSAPTIELKHGEWIDKGWKGDWQFETDGRGNCWYEYKCSECGYIKRGGKSNYCPNCGAIMTDDVSVKI